MRTYAQDDTLFGRATAVFAGSGRPAPGGAESGEGRSESFKHSGLQREEGEFTFAPDVDEASCLQFLDVVRKRSCGDGQRCPGLRAAKRTTGFCNALEQFEAARIGQSLQDSGPASAGERPWTLFVSLCCAADLS